MSPKLLMRINLNIFNEIFRCLIPSFVADFVTVVDWIDENGESLGASDNKTSRTCL